MSLRPIHDKIIIKPQEAVKQTTGGIYIANPTNEGIIEAEIVATGPGAYDDKGNFVKVQVSVGDKILMNSITGQKFKYEEEDYITITENEIVAVLS